jgi:hypothetical protein
MIKIRIRKKLMVRYSCKFLSRHQKKIKQGDKKYE